MRVSLQESMRKIINIIDEKTKLVEAVNINDLAADAANNPENRPQGLKPGEQAIIDEIPTADEQRLVIIATRNAAFPTAKKLARERLNNEFPNWEQIARRAPADRFFLRIENTVESKLGRLLRESMTEFVMDDNRSGNEIHTGQLQRSGELVLDKYLHYKKRRVGSAIIAYHQLEKDMPGEWKVSLRLWQREPGGRNYLHPIEQEEFDWDDFDSAAKKFKKYLGEIAKKR